MTIGAHAIRGLLEIRGLNGPEGKSEPSETFAEPLPGGPLPWELTGDDGPVNQSAPRPSLRWPALHSLRTITLPTE